MKIHAAVPRPEQRAEHANVDPGDEEFVPLTAEQVRLWRLRHPPWSPWRVVVVQAVGGLLVTLLAWALSGRMDTGWSTGYGALCVVIPAAVFAHGVARAPGRKVVVGWLVWELAKLALSIAMLVLAPRLVSGLNWLALLAGMVVTMKMVWVALWVQSRAVTTK